jgi:hypothetical protein
VSCSRSEHPGGHASHHAFNCSYKSRQSRLKCSSASFQLRSQVFNCFSRAMASMTSPYCSYQTSVLTPYFVVKVDPTPVRCRCARNARLLAAPMCSVPFASARHDVDEIGPFAQNGSAPRKGTRTSARRPSASARGLLDAPVREHDTWPFPRPTLRSERCRSLHEPHGEPHPTSAPRPDRRGWRASANHAGRVVFWILAFARMTRVCQSRPYPSAYGGGGGG